MKNGWNTLHVNAANRLAGIAGESVDVLALNTFFKPEAKSAPAGPRSYRLTDDTKSLLADCVSALKPGGLLFVYGLPHELPFAGEFLSTQDFSGAKAIFKYWIALDIDERETTDSLKPSHQGLLLFLKSAPGAKTLPPFKLDTANVRVPHAFCAACGQNVKDWGGKKHLMNPKGAALSDIWRDLGRAKLRNHLIPTAILDRTKALTTFDGAVHLHVVQDSSMLEGEPKLVKPALSQNRLQNGSPLELNSVHQADSVSFLNKLADEHPGGAFDLAFADPPYNLKKDYGNYEDELADEHYIEWCNQWLDGMARTLKPGGSLFVLNLPKWAIHHTAFLNQRLEFRNWIVWDALSDPRGKLMPAHYALLYYTKPGGKPVFNYSPSETADSEKVQSPDSPKYCLRASCIRKRKQIGDDDKTDLSDVWFDVHRIKHKRDRDAHPCQLPDRLMERIIKLATNRGGVVFDPFCGAGTTAIAAMKLGRQFVVAEIDPDYVRITNEKLAALRQQGEMFGEFSVPRVSTKRNKAVATKREIEIYLQRLALKLGKEPAETDIDSRMLARIDAVYPSRLAAIKRCRVVLARAHLKD